MHYAREIPFMSPDEWGENFRIWNEFQDRTMEDDGD
jgi:hypothetical protein